MFGGKFRRDGRARTTNPSGRQEMSGNHEEVFRKSTAKRRVEAGLGGKLLRAGRQVTTNHQG